MKKFGRYLKQFGFLFVVFCTLTNYFLTMSPTIDSFDSAELITGAYSLGIVHAPGYPLFLIVGHLIATLPVGNPALNMNLLNVIYSSLAVGMIFLCCLKLTKSLLISFFCAFLMSVSSLYWAISVVTEVYSLNAFLISIVLYRVICFQEDASNRSLGWLGFAYGMNLAHHPSVIFFAPFLLFLVIKKRWGVLTWRNIFVTGIVICLPFLVYLYFPLRSIANPPLDYVRDYFYKDLTSLSGVLWLMTGKMFSPEMFGRSFGDGLLQFLNLIGILWLNYFGIGLVLSVYGLLVVSRNNFELAVFVGGGSLLILLFFAYYKVVDNSQMIIPAIILLTLPMSAGLSDLLLKFSLKFNNIGIGHYATIGAFLLLILVIVNRPFNNQSKDWTAYYFARQVIEEVLPNSFIVSQWTAATPLEYMQIVEKRRADVKMFDRGLYVLGLRDQLRKNSPEIFSALVKKINEELRGRPVYITENDYVLNDYFCLVHDGLIYRLYSLNSGRNDCVSDYSDGN